MVVDVDVVVFVMFQVYGQDFWQGVDQVVDVVGVVDFVNVQFCSVFVVQDQWSVEVVVDQWQGFGQGQVVEYQVVFVLGQCLVGIYGFD